MTKFEYWICKQIFNNLHDLQDRRKVWKSGGGAKALWGEGLPSIPAKILRGGGAICTPPAPGSDGPGRDGPLHDCHVD